MVLYVLPYVLALGLVKCWLDVRVDSVFGVWFGQSCRLTTCWGFPLANIVEVGWGVLMYGFVSVFPMCWPWVLSSVGLMYGLNVCLGSGWARAAV